MGWEFLILLVVGPLVGLLICSIVKERHCSEREEEEHHILGRYPL